MRMKDDRKIASSDTHSVRKVNGYGSKRGSDGIVFQPIQAANRIVWTQTNPMWPQNRATSSATRSAHVRLRLDQRSIERILSTLRRMILPAAARVGVWLMRGSCGGGWAGA